MGLLGTLFGSGGKNESYNKAAPYINATYQPLATKASGAIGQYADELGGGFDDYRKNAGWDFMLDEGLDGITGNMASRGLLRSGAAGKAFVDYGNNLKRTFYNDYLGHLGTVGGLGLGTGGLIANANQYSKGKGASNGALGGIGQAVGLLGSLFSDRRLKTDIQRVGAFPDGLGIYEYDYVWGGGRQRGVMADEVAELRPWALGPEIGGYATVNYDRLEG